MTKPKYFWSEADRDTIVSICKENASYEIAEILYRADLACENTFVFTHRWDMERCEVPVTFSEKINWNYQFNGDFEWTVMLNRARYMAELGQAFWLTGNEKYVTAYIRIMYDWFKQNPLTEEEIHASIERQYNVKDTWRKLDSGIRIVNWLKGYYCVRTSPLWGEEEEETFIQAVKLHGIYLNIAYTPHDRQSNWGYLETNGLFQIAVLFPQFEESGAWLQTAITRLAIMTKLQVFDDGMQNEQCSMYHHEVLNCLFESVLLAEKNGIHYPEDLKKSLNRMFDASLKLVKPNGRQPMLSDSDDTDIRDVLCHGSILFHRGDLKKNTYSSVDFDGIWYFGQEGIEIFHQINIEDPSFTSTELEQAGYAVMRTDWTDKACYLLFDGGHMDVIRAHGHDDLLHVELSAYGREFLVDPGRCTYKENDTRKYFKESFQHNTISVDGHSISTYVSSWEWKNVANPLNRYWKTCPEFDYVQAGHDGYWRLEHPVQVQRQLLFVKPDYWILVDTCRSSGEHEYEQHFHFAEDLPLAVHPVTGVVETECGEGPNLRVISISESNVSIETCWISRHYNQKVESKKVIFKKRNKGFTKFVTILYPYQNEYELAIREVELQDSYGKIVSSNLATALEIDRGTCSEVVVFSHQGPASYQFAGSHLCGEVILVKRETGKADQSFIVKV